jgi:hypothetical protein
MEIPHPAVSRVGRVLDLDPVSASPSGICAIEVQRYPTTRCTLEWIGDEPAYPLILKHISCGYEHVARTGSAPSSHMSLVVAPKPCHTSQGRSLRGVNSWHNSASCLGQSEETRCAA